MILISVHDSKAETWSPPVCSPTKAAAMRDFGSACTRSETMMSQAPADFDLWQVGEWIGDKIVASQPLHLANGADYVKQVQP